VESSALGDRRIIAAVWARQLTCLSKPGVVESVGGIA